MEAFISGHMILRLFITLECLQTVAILGSIIPKQMQMEGLLPFAYPSVVISKYKTAKNPDGMTIIKSKQHGDRTEITSLRYSERRIPSSRQHKKPGHKYSTIDRSMPIEWENEPWKKKTMHKYRPIMRDPIAPSDDGYRNPVIVSIDREKRLPDDLYKAINELKLKESLRSKFGTEYPISHGGIERTDAYQFRGREMWPEGTEYYEGAPIIWNSEKTTKHPLASFEHVVLLPAEVESRIESGEETKNEELPEATELTLRAKMDWIPERKRPLIPEPRRAPLSPVTGLPDTGEEDVNSLEMFPKQEIINVPMKLSSIEEIKDVSQTLKGSAESKSEEKSEETGNRPTSMDIHNIIMAADYFDNIETVSKNNLTADEIEEIGINKTAQGLKFDLDEKAVTEISYWISKPPLDIKEKEVPAFDETVDKESIISETLIKDKISEMPTSESPVFIKVVTPEKELKSSSETYTNKSLPVIKEIHSDIEKVDKTLTKTKLEEKQDFLKDGENLTVAKTDRIMHRIDEVISEIEEITRPTKLKESTVKTTLIQEHEADENIAKENIADDEGEMKEMKRIDEKLPTIFDTSPEISFEIEEKPTSSKEISTRFQYEEDEKEFDVNISNDDSTNLDEVPNVPKVDAQSEASTSEEKSIEFPELFSINDGKLSDDEMKAKHDINITKQDHSLKIETTAEGDFLNENLIPEIDQLHSLNDTCFNCTPLPDANLTLLNTSVDFVNRIKGSDEEPINLDSLSETEFRNESHISDFVEDEILKITDTESKPDFKESFNESQVTEINKLARTGISVQTLKNESSATLADDEAVLPITTQQKYVSVNSQGVSEVEQAVTMLSESQNESYSLENIITMTNASLKIEEQIFSTQGPISVKLNSPSTIKNITDLSELELSINSSSLGLVQNEEAVEQTTTIKSSGSLNIQKAETSEPIVLLGKKQAEPLSEIESTNFTISNLFKENEGLLQQTVTIESQSVPVGNGEKTISPEETKYTNFAESDFQIKRTNTGIFEDESFKSVTSMQELLTEKIDKEYDETTEAETTLSESTNKTILIVNSSVGAASVKKEHEEIKHTTISGFAEKFDRQASENVEQINNLDGQKALSDMEPLNVTNVPMFDQDKPLKPTLIIQTSSSDDFLVDFETTDERTVTSNVTNKTASKFDSSESSRPIMMEDEAIFIAHSTTSQSPVRDYESGYGMGEFENYYEISNETGNGMGEFENYYEISNDTDVGAFDEGESFKYVTRMEESSSGKTKTDKGETNTESTALFNVTNERNLSTTDNLYSKSIEDNGTIKYAATPEMQNGEITETINIAEDEQLFSEIETSNTTNLREFDDSGFFKQTTMMPDLSIMKIKAEQTETIGEKTVLPGITNETEEIKPESTIENSSPNTTVEEKAIVSFATTSESFSKTVEKQHDEMAEAIRTTVVRQKDLTDIEISNDTVSQIVDKDESIKPTATIQIPFKKMHMEQNETLDEEAILSEMTNKTLLEFDSIRSTVSNMTDEVIKHSTIPESSREKTSSQNSENAEVVDTPEDRQNDTKLHMFDEALFEVTSSGSTSIETEERNTEKTVLPIKPELDSMNVSGGKTVTVTTNVVLEDEAMKRITSSKPPRDVSLNASKRDETVDIFLTEQSTNTSLSSTESSKEITTLSILKDGRVLNTVTVQPSVSVRTDSTSGEDSNLPEIFNETELAKIESFKTATADIFQEDELIKYVTTRKDSSGVRTDSSIDMEDTGKSEKRIDLSNNKSLSEVETLTRTTISNGLDDTPYRGTIIHKPMDTENEDEIAEVLPKIQNETDTPENESLANDEAEPQSTGYTPKLDHMIDSISLPSDVVNATDEKIEVNQAESVDKKTEDTEPNTDIDNLEYVSKHTVHPSKVYVPTTMPPQTIETHSGIILSTKAKEILDSEPSEINETIFVNQSVSDKEKNVTLFNITRSKTKLQPVAFESDENFIFNQSPFSGEISTDQELKYPIVSEGSGEAASGDFGSGLLSTDISETLHDSDIHIVKESKDILEDKTIEEKIEVPEEVTTMKNDFDQLEVKQTMPQNLIFTNIFSETPEFHADDIDPKLTKITDDVTLPAIDAEQKPATPFAEIGKELRSVEYENHTDVLTLESRSILPEAQPVNDTNITDALTSSSLELDLGSGFVNLTKDEVGSGIEPEQLLTTMPKSDIDFKSITETGDEIGSGEIITEKANVSLWVIKDVGSGAETTESQKVPVLNPDAEYDEGFGSSIKVITGSSLTPREFVPEPSVSVFEDESIKIPNVSHVEIAKATSTKPELKVVNVPEKSPTETTLDVNFKENEKPVPNLGSGSWEDPFFYSNANLADLDPEEEISFYIAALPICPYVYHCGVGKICSIVPCPYGMYCCKSRIGICCIPHESLLNSTNPLNGIDAIVHHIISHSKNNRDNRLSMNRILSYPDNVKRHAPK